MIGEIHNTRIVTGSLAQRTLLKGCYGQPLTDEELEVWQQATRRASTCVREHR